MGPKKRGGMNFSESRPEPENEAGELIEVEPKLKKKKVAKKADPIDVAYDVLPDIKRYFGVKLPSNVTGPTRAKWTKLLAKRGEIRRASTDPEFLERLEKEPLMRKWNPDLNKLVFLANGDHNQAYPFNWFSDKAQLILKRKLLEEARDKAITTLKSRRKRLTMVSHKDFMGLSQSLHRKGMPFSLATRAWNGYQSARTAFMSIKREYAKSVRDGDEMLDSARSQIHATHRYMLEKFRLFKDEMKKFGYTARGITTKTAIPSSCLDNLLDTMKAKCKRPHLNGGRDYIEDAIRNPRFNATVLKGRIETSIGNSKPNKCEKAMLKVLAAKSCGHVTNSNYELGDIYVSDVGKIKKKPVFQINKIKK